MACPELDGPPCPSELVYVLEWFGELSAARGSGAAGANPIGYAEIAAWSHLTGLVPTPFEVSVLRRLDAAFLTALTRKPARG